MTDADDLSIDIEKIKTYFKQYPAKTAQNIFFFPYAESTNDIVAEYAGSGCEEGTVVIADSQSNGRGRLGREWFSPSGRNIYISVALKPDLPPTDATILTIMTSIAIANVIRRIFKINALIKWPNDIIVAGKKIAGILSEIKTEADKIAYVIVGVGINVNMEYHEMPDSIKSIATSLRIETGKTVQRTDIVIAILRELDILYNLLRESGNAPLINEWTRLSETIGKNIRVASGNQAFEGLAEAIDGKGFLLMRVSNGQLKKISSGDVTVIS